MAPEAGTALTHRSSTLRSAIFIGAGFYRTSRACQPGAWCCGLPASGASEPASTPPGCVTGWHHRLRPLPPAGHPCPVPSRSSSPFWLHGSGSQQTGLLKEMLPCLPPKGTRPGPLYKAPPHSVPSRLGGLRIHHAFSISTAHRAPHVAGGTGPLLKKPPHNWCLGDSKAWNPREERGVSTASLEHPGWSESRAHQNQLGAGRALGDWLHPTPSRSG